MIPFICRHGAQVVDHVTVTSPLTDLSSTSLLKFTIAPNVTLRYLADDTRRSSHLPPDSVSIIKPATNAPQCLPTLSSPYNVWPLPLHRTSINLDMSLKELLCTFILLSGEPESEKRGRLNVGTDIFC
jgi:hypothetical protein